MTVKEHYDNHLGDFYSWYIGDFDVNKDRFKALCVEQCLKPDDTGCAIDLGSGNGIQSIALAELGFKVKAIDFNRQLNDELKSRVDDFQIEVFEDDIKNIGAYSAPQPELIVCCGDTLCHLESLTEIEKLIADSFDILLPKGRLILSFRDYSTELFDTSRFIPVKSDANRILTCFVEYLNDKLRVTDLLHELENDRWIQKISSYYKTRISRDLAVQFLTNSGFSICFETLSGGMLTLIAQKK